MNGLAVQLPRTGAWQGQDSGHPMQAPDGTSTVATHFWGCTPGFTQGSGSGSRRWQIDAVFCAPHCRSADRRGIFVRSLCSIRARRVWRCMTVSVNLLSVRSVSCRSGERGSDRVQSAGRCGAGKGGSLDDLVLLRSTTSFRWNKLVRLAMDDLTKMVDRFVEHLAEDAVYTSDIVGDGELRAAAQDSFALLVVSLLEGGEAAEWKDIPQRLGRTRARQRVPVDKVVAAIRVDFHVVWETLLEHASAGDMAAMALHVDRLWAAVDVYGRRVEQAYLEERAVMAREEHGEQREYLVELFTDAVKLPLRIKHIALALHVDPGATFRVVAGNAKRNARLVHRAAAQLRAADAPYFALDHGDGVIAFWPAPTVRSAPAAELQYRALEGTAMGLLPEVRGLAEVPAAAHTAQQIAGCLRSDEAGLIALTEVWARIAKEQIDAGGRLSESVLRGLDAVAADEGERIREAVWSYLRTGSAAETAQLLYCHRNTVLNRLQRFRALTGLDVTVPEQAALAFLILS